MKLWDLRRRFFFRLNFILLGWNAYNVISCISLRRKTILCENCCDTCFLHTNYTEYLVGVCVWLPLGMCVQRICYVHPYNSSKIPPAWTTEIVEQMKKCSKELDRFAGKKNILSLQFKRANDDNCSLNTIKANGWEYIESTANNNMNESREWKKTQYTSNATTKSNDGIG